MPRLAWNWRTCLPQPPWQLGFQTYLHYCTRQTHFFLKVIWRRHSKNNHGHLISLQYCPTTQRCKTSLRNESSPRTGRVCVFNRKDAKIDGVKHTASSLMVSAGWARIASDSGIVLCPDEERRRPAHSHTEACILEQHVLGEASKYLRTSKLSSS